MRLRYLLYLLPLAVFAMVAGYFVVGLHRNPEDIPSALIGKPAPEFSLPGLDGVAPGFTTADLKGRVTVVNVFASWCVPCRAEHPYMMRFAREDGMRILGINYRDKPADAKAWLDRLGNPYARIGVDRDARVSINWGVYGVPETFVVDADGIIRFKQVGPITTPDLAAKLRRKIAEAAK